MIKLLTVLCALFVSSIAFGAPSLTVDRTVMVSGIIANKSLEEVGRQIVQWSLADHKKPVNLIIDSPGGSVFVGAVFINQMEEARGEGVKLRCFVSGMAASMAFSILLHCDERYALSNTYLLWHPVRVVLRNALTARETKVIARDVAIMDAWILRDLNAALPDLSENTIKYHFYNETFHLSRELAKIAPHFLQVYDSIPGLAATLLDPKLKKSTPPPMFSFDLASIFKPGTIVYMK